MMQQDLIEIEERKVCEDRCTNFRGTASVRLEVLDFDVEGSRTYSTSDETSDETFAKVERLKDIFGKEGCYRFKPENRISAIIDQRSLEDAIQASPGVASIETLLKNPKGVPPDLKLPQNYRLKCLQGRSRVQAAKECLQPQEWSWAVDLYLEDSSLELRTWLAEQYSNAAKFSDGEIYQKIRHYRGNKFAEGRWWARLSSDKQKNLKQLLGHDKFAAAFEALLPIPGLWSGFRIGMIPDFMAMKCDEEILYRLKLILDVWSFILEKNRELMGLADNATVKAFELRVPALCSEDSKFLESLMSEGVLLPGLNDKQKLRRIWSNVLKVKCLIPTLFTFFEDIKWLMPPVKIMKQLLGKKFKGTVREAMVRKFSGANQSEEEVKVQVTESTFRSYRGTRMDQIRLGVFQLWLFLARDFTDMIPECPKKEEGQDTPVPKTPDTHVWHEFAVLAYNLGFECKEINLLRSKNRDREIARAALLEARKPPRFTYDETAFESHQSQMADMFGTAKENATPSVKPEFFVDGSGENLKRRCGRTFVNAYAYDRQRLFLKAFLVPNQVGGQGITSLFVRVSVILAFFGELVLGSAACWANTPTALSDILGQPVGPETEVFTLQQGGRMLTSPERSEQEAGLKVEVDRLRSELTRAGEDYSKVRQEMQELVKQKAGMEQTVRGLQAEASDLRSRVVNQEKEVENLRDDQVRVETTEKRIQALNMEIADLRREHETDIEALESARSNNQKLSDTCRELEGKLKKVEAAESETPQEYRREIGELSARNNELQEEVRQLITKNHQLRQDLDTSATTQLAILNECSTEKQKLLASKEELQRDLDVSKIAHQNALEKASTENKDLLARNKGLLDEKEKLLMQIDALQQELKSCQTKLEEVSTEKEELSASHKQLLNENKKLLLKINEDAFSEEEAELLANHKSKEEDLEAEADQLRNERSKLEQRLADMGRLEAAWLGQTEEITNLKERLSQSLQEMEKMKENAGAELERRLEVEKTNRTTQEQLNLKILENQELQKRVDSLARRVGSLEKELMGVHDEAQKLAMSNHQQMGEQERRTPDPLARLINFKYVNNNRLVQGESTLLPPLEVERVVNKYMMKGMHPYTMGGRGLSAKNAFQIVTNDGSNTILLVPIGEQIEIDGRIITYPGRESEELSNSRRPKRDRNMRLSSPVSGQLDSPQERPNPFAGLGTAVHLEGEEPLPKRGKK